MSGLFGTLQMARGAMQAQQRGVQNASGNIANVNTPGYARRTVQLQATTPELPVGGGVTVSSEARTVDNFLRSQTQRSNVDLAYANARENGLSALEGVLLPEGQSPIDDAITGFFTAMSALASDPSSTSQRTETLLRAQTLANSFNDASSRISETRQALDTRINDSVKRASSLSTTVADLNRQITEKEASGQEASVLRDQRDVAAGELAALTGGRILTSARGEVSVLAFGTTLVDGPVAQRLSTRPNTTDGLADVVVTDGNNVSQVVTSRVLGGTLGGILSARDADAVAHQAGLDALAQSFASTINAAHAAGFGLDGVGGRPLFSGNTAAGLTVAITDGRQLAASDSAATLPGNNVNALAMAGMDTFSETHRELVATLAASSEDARSLQAQRADQFATADAMEQSVSGVSVDEELTRLMQFQRGYEASAKVIKTVNDLLDTLMTL